MTRGMQLGIIAVCLCAAAATARAETVSWRQVGHPSQTRKIAACSDGRLYALNADRTLHVNRTGGTDDGWTYIGYPHGAQAITCAGNQLFAFNDDRTLWRNTAVGDAVSWSYVGRPGGARQIVGSTNFVYVFPLPVLYALNDDNTLYVSGNGQDGSWRQVGRPGAADRLAVGGGVNEARVFALNHDKHLYINTGNGCDAYWRWIDRPHAAIEIAARHQTRLYALNSDYTLWEGTVNRRQQLVRITTDQLPGLLSLLGAHQVKLQAHKTTGTFTSSGMLQSLGIPSITFAVPKVYVSVAGFGFNIWVQHLETDELGIEIDDDGLRVLVPFLDNGDEIHVDSPAPNFNIDGMWLEGRLHSRTDACHQAEIVSGGVIFHGELSANGPLGIFDGLLNKAVNLKQQVESRLNVEAAKYLGRTDLQRNVRSALLWFAALRTGETWSNVVGTSLVMDGGVVEYIVEK